MSNRIGVMVDSFRLGVLPGLDAAKRVGAGAVQIYAGERGATSSVWTGAYRREVLGKVKDLGMRVSAICGDLGGFGFELAAENPWRIEETKCRLDLVRELEAHVLTAHIGVVPDDEKHPRYPVMQEALGRLGEYARDIGAVVAIETGPEKPETLKRFIESMRGGVGANYDPANLKMVLDVDPVQGVHTLSGHIAHTHAKDGRMLNYVGGEVLYHYFAEGGIGDKRLDNCFIETPLGQGDVDVKAWIGALDAVGYEGIITIEREAGADPAKDIGDAVNFLRTLL